jgi:hypothetical protein
MSDLTEKFAALEEQLTSQNAAILFAMSGIADTLDLLNTSLDLLNNNGATNTRYLLDALSRNDPCRTCGSGTIGIPPLNGATSPIDEDKCKRAQAFVHAMTVMMTVLDPVSAFGVGFSPQLITDAWNEVITQLGNTDDIPVISWTEAAQLFGDLVNYGAGNALVGGTLSSYFAELAFDLRDAVYGASSASGAKGAYDTVIDDSSLPSYVKPVLKNAAYAGLVNYYLDSGSTPNLTGYDGTICGFPIGYCVELTAILYTNLTGGGSEYATDEPFGAFTPHDSVTSSSGVINFDHTVFYGGNAAGWTYEVLAGEARIQYRTGGLSDTGLFSTTGTSGTGTGVHAFPAPTGCFAIVSGTPFSVRLCFAGV